MTLAPSQRRAWIVLSVAVWGIVVLILLPPYVGFGGREILMSAFRPLCHQLPERSPSLDGVQLAVCHRCFGIYAGIAISATVVAAVIGFARPLEPYARLLLPASLIPVSIDWLADFIGLWSNTPASRLTTGAIFGAVGGVFLARAVVDIFQEPQHRPQQADSVPIHKPTSSDS